VGFFPFASAAAQLPWLPPDNTLLAANSDPLAAQQTALATAGTLYLMKITPRSTILISTVWLGMSVVGAGASTGSFVGVYSPAGTLLTGSADIAASLTGALGAISNAVTTPQTVLAGASVWIALLTNLAVTQPLLCKGLAGTAASLVNADLAAASFRFATNGTALSALPASFTPSANANGPTWWVGVS
jgi:hypothetical protein